jgi:hypothetical protein
MKLGDRFWVSDYYSHQEGLVEFEVVDIIPEDPHAHVKYVGCRVEDLEKDHRRNKYHYFTEFGSPDVMSARIYRTKAEVKEFEARLKDYEERREKAKAIFPEGFDE